MRAGRVVALDGPSAMQVEDVAEPTPGDGEVLVEVHHAGVTFPDVLLTRGQYQYRPDPPFTPGSEAAGVVLSAPDGSGFSEGQRVAAFPGEGGFAEQLVCPADQVFALPDEVSTEVGASLPMNYLTVEFALARRGRLEEGETVLVHGAAGGIGTATLQLATAMGARCIAVVSTEEKEQVAREAGAAEVVRSDGFKDAVLEVTDGRGVDMVVDPVGGDRFTDSLRSLATEGRVLVIGFAGGGIPTVKVNRLLLNNVAVVGVGWGAFASGVDGYAQGQWERLVPHLRSGALDPPIGATYPLDDVAAAVGSLEDRSATGKVLVALR